jgi:hypothetical protein
MRIVGFIVGIVLFCWATVSAFSIFSELKFLGDGWMWSVDQVPITIKSVALMVGKHVSGVVGGYREFVHGLVQMLHLPHLPQFIYDVLGIAAFSVGRGRSWFLGKIRQQEKFRPQALDALWKDPSLKAKLQARAAIWGREELVDRYLEDPNEKEKFLSSGWEYKEQAVEMTEEERDLSRVKSLLYLTVLSEVLKLQNDRFPLRRAYLALDSAAVHFPGIRALPFSWRLLLTELFSVSVVYVSVVAILIAALFGIDFLYRHFA